MPSLVYYQTTKNNSKLRGSAGYLREVLINKYTGVRTCSDFYTMLREEALTYLGLIKGKYWAKNQLRISLQPVMDFQKKYGVHIYIGEFSAIR